MQTLTQTPAENITVGMFIIPTGRKHPLEVVTADKGFRNNNRALGCYGKGFTVHSVKSGEMVTVVS